MCKEQEAGKELQLKHIRDSLHRINLERLHDRLYLLNFFDPG